jgi:hypothetical protein
VLLVCCKSPSKLCQRREWCCWHAKTLRCPLQDALAQTLAHQQEADGEDASGGRGVAADDSDMEPDMDDDDDRPPSRQGSGLNAANSVCTSCTCC